MKRVMILLVALLGITNISYAGNGGSSIREAAYKLDHATSEFYQNVRYEYGRSHLSKRAKRLAKATHRFCADVERGANFNRLWREFDHLKSRFRDMQHELKYARNHGRQEAFSYGGFGWSSSHRGLGFKRVGKWFDRLDRAMYIEHERYSRHSRQRHDARDYAHNDGRNQGRRNDRRGDRRSNRRARAY